MVRVRHLSIRNFRAIRAMDWAPSAGINCLIGPGDSGKSSVLEAIDLCLGARRSARFSDTDFHLLNVAHPIQITVTVGALPDELLNLDTYGEFLRGFDTNTKLVEDEPHADIETVLSVQLQVGADLEPVWSLFSNRAVAQGIERGLAWKHRALLAPARIGQYASTHLSWNRSSVLNRLTEERPDLGAELARAARDARAGFGNQASAQLAQTLQTVALTAANLGVHVGQPQALLDAHAVSIGDGAIALHDQAGVPLHALGTGSARLLTAGLQRAAAQASTIALVDEVEYGLEPHRLKRLLDSLGAKEANAPLQVFLTTHSPVALRELSSSQLFIVRKQTDFHEVRAPGLSDHVQSTLRTDPEAFLARSLLVCEGASEIGLARGLDQYWTEHNHPSFFALGGSYVNAGGSTPDLCLQRSLALRRLGYRVMVFIDADKPHTQTLLDEVVREGIDVLTWQQGQALEDAIFFGLPDQAIDALLAFAEEEKGTETVAEHIRSRSSGTLTLDQIKASRAQGVPYAPPTRQMLGQAARTRNGWFKNVTAFQHVGRRIVGPYALQSAHEFLNLVNQLRGWTRAAGD
ncbi:MAG TPA: ATP-dependent endonuclease [Pseudomonas sp.]|uniref:ATP-dependent nuclease n=1 Tax=Pseudomonas sp. IC_126 TaxID=2547400 RepID=UPI000E91BD5B|nr:ATP-binding protein [Pseudomonas sp. IC_126]TCD24692.1 ATP-dependent endonuclease [Pseudomonas sp. IC_126]HAR04090.1 ATP-dependent endonuclease [Pseudomonas sp.]